MTWADDAQVYDLIGRPLTAEVRGWVHQATTAQSMKASNGARAPSADAFGTRRNSSATVEAWRHWMSPSESRVVEKNCAEVSATPVVTEFTYPNLNSCDARLCIFCARCWPKVTSKQFESLLLVSQVMKLLGYLPLDGRLTDLQLPSFDENLPSFL